MIRKKKGDKAQQEAVDASADTQSVDESQQPEPKQGEKGEFNANDHALMKHHGLEGIIRLGLSAANELKVKNRLIAILGTLCILLVVAVWGLSIRTIEPVVLSETADGRIRPLPLLENPIYTQNEILAWADKCVRDIYDLSYVDWRTSVYNNTRCLSDRGRQGFVNSLGRIGVLELLDEKNLGIVYAVPGKAIIKNSITDGSRYAQWIVEVPYVLQVEGRRKGKIEATMTMKIDRVPMSLRDAGIWVDSYQVKPGVRR